METPLIERAQRMIEQEAADFVIEGVNALLSDGTAEWIEDPEVDGVAARPHGNADRAPRRLRRPG